MRAVSQGDVDVEANVVEDEDYKWRDGSFVKEMGEVLSSVAGKRSDGVVPSPVSVSYSVWLDIETIKGLTDRGEYCRRMTISHKTELIVSYGFLHASYRYE